MLSDSGSGKLYIREIGIFKFRENGLSLNTIREKRIRESSDY